MIAGIRSHSIKSAIRKLPLKKLFFCALVIGGCVLFKAFFIGADALDLDWLLYPSKLLVSVCSGLSFVWAGSLGYYNAELEILIAPACSGLNFFIIQVATGGCLTALRTAGIRQWTVWLAGIIPAAYLFTLLANTIRILLAILLYSRKISLGPLTPERLHRLEGIAVYFICLCIFAVILSALLRRKERRHSEAAGSVAKTAPAAVGAAVALPFFCYLFFTVVVPLANSLIRGSSQLNVEHFAVVAALSAGISLCLYLLLRGKYRVFRVISRVEHEHHQAQNPDRRR